MVFKSVASTVDTVTGYRHTENRYRGNNNGYGNDINQRNNSGHSDLSRSSNARNVSRAHWETPEWNRPSMPTDSNSDWEMMRRRNNSNGSGVARNGQSGFR